MKLKERLIEEGLWARKGLGQHFLLDPEITRRVAAAAGDIASKPVLEIGPGPGGLTRALLERGAEPLVAIERDPRFVAFLSELADEYPGRLIVIEADALAADEPALLAAAGVAAPVTIAANLPYNVGTPLLVKWLGAGAWRGAMSLMFQFEVAQRIAAKPGDEAYGRLAVLAQAVATARVVMKLPPRAFTPAPKVASAVVRLEDRPDRFTDLEALERVTAAAFGQRRKMLRSSLAVLGDPAPLLEAAGALATQRAEEISVEGFRRMAAAWRARSESLA